MILDFSGEVIEWRGPAPLVFASVPADLSSDIMAISPHVSYGWGCIPVVAQIGDTKYKTSLFPKNGVYMVPVKLMVQRAECVAVGDHVTVRLEIFSGFESPS